MYEIGRCCIKEILEEIGWDQQQLADYAGMPKQTISQYTTGERTRMSLLVAVRICDAIERHAKRKISPRDLFDWKISDTAAKG